MDNVLDLKNPPEEIPVVEPVEAGVPAEDFASALFASAPRTIAWEAHHPLAGGARRKHAIFLGGIVAVGALIAFWQGSFPILLVAIAGAGALEAKERWGKPTKVAIDEHGIAVDGAHRMHGDFASFDIHQMPDNTVELSLHTTKWHAPYVRLPLGEQNPDDVRAVLMQYIPEGRHTVPLWDYYIRKP